MMATAEKEVSQLKDLKPKKPVAVPLIEYLRRAVMIKKYSNRSLGTSKHHDSHAWPSIPARRKAKKTERQNRKAGRS